MLKIYAGTIENPIIVLRKVMQKIHTNKHVLNRVQIVEMDITPCDEGMDNPDDNTEASVLGKEFYQIMPLVHNLYLDNISPIPVVPGFINALINSYSPRLQRITCPHWALEDVDRFSTNLTHFLLSDTIHSMHMPQVCSSSLRVLSLRNVRNDILWKSFENESNPRTLCFSNLITLNAWAYVSSVSNVGNFEHRYPALQFSHKIFAPKLEKVSINLCPHTLSMLSSIQGQSVIKCVEFSTAKALWTLTGLNMNKARDLFSSYAKGDHQELEVVESVAYMNDILSIDGLAEHISVRYAAYNTIHYIEDIDWKHLNELCIYGRRGLLLKITDLPLLLSKISGLQHLKMGGLEPVSEGKFLDNILDSNAVEPIESVIGQVSVYISSSWTKADVDNLNGYLRKLLPNSKIIVEN